MPQYWEHRGALYELLTLYSLPEDAWTLELTSHSSPFPKIAAIIPDEDVARPVTIALTKGELPAAVVRQFLKAVEAEERRIGRRVEDSIEPADPREPKDPPRIRHGRL